MTFNASDATGAQSVLHWSRATPQAIAAMEGGNTYGYSQLAEHVARFVVALRQRGVGHGMLVVLECNRRYLHLTMTLALEAIGAVVASSWASELPPGGKLVAHADWFLVESRQIQIPVGRPVAYLDQGFIDGVMALPLPPDWQELLAAPVAPTAAVRLSRTSGTTGEPKFMLSKRALIDSGLNVMPEMLNSRLGLFHHVCIHHFNFAGTYYLSMLALRFGHAVCYSRMETFFADVNRFPYSNATLLVGEAAKFVAEAASLPSHLNACSVGVIGGALTPRLQQALLHRIAIEVRNNYQANEAIAIARMDEAGLGTLLPEVEIRIVDDRGEDLPSGASGIIMVRSPRVVDGYLWDEALTRQHFIAGWYRTSDVGFIPEPGKLVVLGRADDMLNVGGVKVAPHPIEENIKALPGVVDAVVLAFDDEHGAGELHVVVERRDPALDAGLHAQIPALMTGYFGTFKVHYVDRLPRTHTSKVQRNLVRAHLLQQPAR